MTADARLSESNPPAYWRQEPVVLREVADTSAVSLTDFASWCRAPATVRLYQRREEAKAGSAIAVHLPSPDLAFEIYRGATRRSEDLTVMINGLEKVVPNLLGELRPELPQGPNWRSDDLVSTLSRVGSSIGFHAGHEDGYVLQIAGSRHWRVWHHDTLSKAYKQFLLGLGTDEYSVVPCRPSAEPLIDVTLSAGDALYIPALFPHEGITLEESISLSIAWRGFSPFTLLRRFFGAEILDAVTHAAKGNDAYFCLLSDPPSDCQDIAKYLTDVTATTVDLRVLGVRPEDLYVRLARRLSLDRKL